jgi:AcrR family transcriptional regulator
MVEATRALLAEGVVSPTVELVADRALVSRTTAYRYFPNQHALLLATFPELDDPSLLGEDPPSGALERLEIVCRSVARQVVEHEPELRAMLRMSLELGPGSKDAIPLRGGRVIRWVGDALAPIAHRFSTSELRRLVLAIRASVGIEPLVWLTDVGGLSATQASSLMCSSAQAILRCALIDAGIDDEGRRIRG